MPAWRVRLEGSSAALEALPRLLPRTCSVVEEDATNYLESPEFENLTEPESVMSIAIQAVEAANLVAAVHIQGWHPVTCDAVAQVQGDGTRHWAKLVSTSVNVSARLTPSPTVIRADGTVDEPPAPPAFNEVADLVLQSEPLKRALSFLREASWASLYKAYEIVRDAVGGEKKLRDLRWVPDSLLTRFTRTCQSPKAIGAEARHGVEVGTPPATPLSHPDAKRVVVGLLERWVASQVALGRG
jgi:hypothetical protein